MKNPYEKNNFYYVRYDLNAFEITGSDSDNALNYFLTKDNEFSDENTVNYQLALDDDGSVLAEVIVYKLEEKYLLFSPQNLEKIINNNYDDLSINKNNKLKLIQVNGDKMPMLINPLYDYDISTLEFRSIDNAIFNKNNILLSHYGFNGKFGYQIVLDNNLLDDFTHQVLSDVNILNDDSIIKSFAEFGQPINKLLFNKKYSLANLGYLWNVDFTKDNFKGKKILLDSVNNLKHLIIGIKSKSKLSEDKDIFFDKKNIGKVLEVFHNDEDTLALCMIDYKYAVSGAKFLDVDQNLLISHSSPYYN